jgi:hypothetical protein
MKEWRNEWNTLEPSVILCVQHHLAVPLMEPLV